MRVTLTCYALLCFSLSPAHAAEAQIPVTVNIIQCGAKDNIENMCEKDSRCCVFLDKAERRFSTGSLSKLNHTEGEKTLKPSAAVLKELYTPPAVGGSNTMRR